MSGNELSAQNVLIVPGDRAYDFYKKFSAYVCQPGRYFRPNAVRLGFFAYDHIQREFPRILARRGRISLTEETVHDLGKCGDPEEARFAEVVKRLIAEGRDGEVQEIVLLSGPEDPQTLRLSQPIQNTKSAKSGRHVAWTQKQGYVSEVALLRNPTTTTELDAWSSETIAQTD